MALQALSEFGTLIFADTTSVSIAIKSHPSVDILVFGITPGNALLLQTANVSSINLDDDLDINAYSCTIVKFKV